MPISTTTLEARRIMGKNSNAITRYYPSGAPFEVGDKTTLFVDTGTGVKQYAAITVKSIRPCSLESRRADAALATGEGFGHPVSWEKNLREMYGSVIESRSSENALTRIVFDVDKMLTFNEPAPDPERDKPYRIDEAM